MGDLLDQKEYGIAFARPSDIKDRINVALLVSFVFVCVVREP